LLDRDLLIVFVTGVLLDLTMVLSRRRLLRSGRLGQGTRRHLVCEARLAIWATQWTNTQCAAVMKTRKGIQGWCFTPSIIVEADVVLQKA